MKDFKPSDKRSFIGSIYKNLLGLLNVDDKLAKASYKQLQLLEDTKTPVSNGYEKEMTGGGVCWWINKDKSNNGVLIYLPGGGFVMGPLKLHWAYCEQMSKELDMAVVVIRYRLAPEYPFPAGLNDIVDAITTFQQKGILKEKWFLAGDSAGGNLALAATLKLAACKAALPKKIILAYPTVDMTENANDPEVLRLNEKDIILSTAFAEKVKESYVGQHDVKDPLLSPINGNLSVLPPVLLQHGTDDILVKGSREFAKKMREAGKALEYEEYEGMFHGFTLSPGLPEAKKAIQSQIAFIKRPD